MLSTNEESAMLAQSTLTVSDSEAVDGKRVVTYCDDSNMRQNLRMRRTKSVARAEEITKEAEKVRRSQPDKPYTNFFSNYN